MIERALCLRMPWKNFLPCLPRHSSVNRVCYGYEGGALLVYLCNGQAIVYLLHFRVLCTKCLRICQKDFFATQYLSNVIFLVAKLVPITVNTSLGSPTWLGKYWEICPKRIKTMSHALLTESGNAQIQIHKYTNTERLFDSCSVSRLCVCQHADMG